MSEIMNVDLTGTERSESSIIAFQITKLRNKIYEILIFRLLAITQ